MKKEIDPIVYNGTYAEINEKWDILINLIIRSALRLNYDVRYGLKGMPIMLQLEDNEGNQGTIILTEDEFYSSKMLNHIFDRYEMQYSNFRPFVNRNLSGKAATKLLRKIICDYAQDNVPIRIPFYGGWEKVDPSSQTYVYTRPMNTYYRALAKNQYLFYQSIDGGITTQIRQLAMTENLCEQFLVRFSRILDPDMRCFLFLYWHYSYMYSLCDPNGHPNILSLEIPDPNLRNKIRTFYFGGPEIGSCELESSNTTRQAFNKKFYDTKDIPFVVEERISASRNTLRTKIKDLQEMIAEQTAYMQAAPVPVLFSCDTPEYQGLLHIQVETEDISKLIHLDHYQSLNVYPYFKHLEASLKQFSWDSTLLQFMQGCIEKKSPLMYANFSALFAFLKYVYSKNSIELESQLGFPEDIGDFLDRYLPQLESIPTIKGEAFLDAAKLLLHRGEIHSFRRLAKEPALCVTYKELTDTPCVLIDDENWSFNHVAIDLIIKHIPRVPSHRLVLRQLHKSGMLSDSRINQASYQNKLTVHLTEGGTSSQLLVSLRAKYFVSPRIEQEMKLMPDHRYFLLGKNENSGSNLYMDFDSAEKSNRHILITGKSGVGKSYLLQNLLQQAADKHITTLIIHSQGELPDIPNSQVINVDREKPSISLTDEEKRDPRLMASLLRQSLRLRESQYDTVYICYQKYLQITPSPSLFGFFKMFKELAKEAELKNYSSVQSKLYSIIESKAFSADPINWKEYAGKTLVLDFRDCSNYENLFQVQIELFLHDLYAYKAHSGTDDPLIAVVDEFQKLNTNDGGMLVKILREGRKCGWALWLASQLIESGQGREIKKLSAQASVQLYFSQGSQGNRRIANVLGLTTKQKSFLFTELQSLKVGEFLIQEDGKEIRKCIGEH